MPIVGYDPLPNGLIRFRKDDGTAQSFLADTPEATQLKAWVDQTSGADARTAQNDAGLTNPDGSLAEPGVMGGRAAQPTRTDATAAPPPPKPVGPTWAELGQFDAKGNKIGPPVGTATIPAEPMGFGTRAPATPAPVARTVPSTVPAAAAQGAPPGARPAPSPGRVEPPGKPGDVPAWPGAAAPSAATGGAGDAVKEFTSGLAKPGAGSGGASKSKLVKVKETIEGERTPEEIDRNMKMVRAQQAVNDASLAEVEDIAQKKTAFHAAEAENAADSAIDAHHRMLEAQDNEANVKHFVQGKVASLQREQDAVANQKVDPRRLFSGDAGTLYAITSTLGVALGAFGASLSGGPNYAQQIVQASIQRDIDAQTDAIRRRGDNANNAMSNFMKVHGLDIDEAKLAVKAIGQQYAGSLAQIQASKLGALDAQQKAAEFRVQMMNESNKNLADLATKLEAKKTAEYKLGGGGTGGPGFKWIDDGNGNKMLFNTKTGKIEQTVKGGNVSQPGTEKIGSGGPGKLSARLGAQVSTNESAIEDLDNFIRAREGKGLIRPDIPFVPNSDARVDVHSLVTAIKGKVVVGSNGSVNQEEMDEIGKMLDSPREEVAIAGAKRLKEALGTAHTAIERQRGGVERGVGPDEDGNQ